jgi:hypothetical protein
MKSFSVLILSTLSFLIFVNQSKAQFQVDAQFRSRFEFRDGYRQLQPSNAAPSFIISQRSRLSFGYQSEKLKLKFSPQDVRVWGDEQNSSSTGVFGDNASLDMFEAYAEIRLDSSFYISVGRQELCYDNERLLAKRDWNQNGLSYDAIVLKIKLNAWDIHAGSTWNSLSETSANNLYLPDRIKSLNYLWIHRKFNNNIQLSFTHITSGVTETDSTNTLHFRQTTGVYSEYKSEKWNYRADFYYQYGKNKTANTINAFLADADISYKFGHLNPGIGLSYLSGNSNSGSKTDQLFDVLYGLRHRYFGTMDYFINFPANTKNGGLADLYAYVKYGISKQISIKNTGNYFQLAQTNSATPANKNLGYENDLELNYKFNEWGTVKTAYMFFLPTESLKTMQAQSNVKFQQFIFLELMINTCLFIQKLK